MLVSLKLCILIAEMLGITFRTVFKFFAPHLAPLLIFSRHTVFMPARANIEVFHAKPLRYNIYFLYADFLLPKHALPKWHDKLTTYPNSVQIPRL